MKYKGFVYIWYDRKRKLFYIGSHMGEVSDRYICSSKRMNNAFKKRPQDFKRRIIKFTNNVLEEEQRYLDMIKHDELLYGKTPRYYNVKRYAAGGDVLEGYTEEHKQKIYKKRYGKKHSNSVKKAIQNRSPEKKKLHQERRSKTLKEKYASGDIVPYQSVSFDLYINNKFHKHYNNKKEFRNEFGFDSGTFNKHFKSGEWVLKHSRKSRNLKAGDKLTFKLDKQLL